MFRLGSIGRTSIHIDLSFLILIAFFVAMNYNQSLGLHWALLWIPVIFISVLIHELAHAAMIAALGFGASQIVLGGMGGVTINQRAARPWQDMLISVAGPFASFGLMFLAGWMRSNVGFIREDAMFNPMFHLLTLANLFWGIFNLIPVPPLDGGHATRDFFRMFLAERPAFVISIWIAMVAGGVIAIWAFSRGQFFIALFIAWFTFSAFQRWQQYKDEGVPGD
jgi:Zn-dependent protease